MTARDEAIEVGNRAMLERYGYEPVSARPGDAYWVHALDAIPAGVLARLAIERGGLVEVDIGSDEGGYLYDFANGGRDLDMLETSLYRVTSD
jgi:hypothetical protein